MGFDLELLREIMISCIIPFTINEISYIDKCLYSLLLSASLCKEEVEIIIVENGEEIRFDTSKYGDKVKRIYISHSDMDDAKNTGAQFAKGDIFCFLDADNTVTEEYFSEISEKSKNDYFIGGGTKYWESTRKFTLGIYTFFILALIIFIIRHIINPFSPPTVLSFWIRKDVFFKIGKWIPCSLTGLSKFFFYVHPRFDYCDDIHFGVRVKKYAKIHNKKFESLKRTKVIWNTRKFDKFGDWSWIKWLN